jgi:hypothetical protein
VKIFISYSRQDEALLVEFIKQLDAATNVGASLDYWYDKDRQDGIQGGEAWEARLSQEIEGCDVFCLFLTSNSAASPNCRSELTAAQSKGKRIVQIRVRSTFVPLPQASFLPNRDVWIASTGDQGLRDDMWREVVTELQRIKPDQQRAKPSQFPEFERLCDMIDRLKTFKHFHDLAHELYEDHYKNLAEEFKTGDLDADTVGDCAAFIESAIADLAGLRADNPAYFSERDKLQIDQLNQSLEACKASLDNLSRKSSPTDSPLDELKWKLPKLGSSLGLALSYFNERMVESAKGFDAKRFAEALDGILAAHQEWKEEWSRLAASIDDARGRLLKEHDVLQNVQANLLKFEPENLDDRRKRDRFMSAWPEVAESIKPLLDQWKERPNDTVLDALARQQRLKLATCFASLDGSITAMDAADASTEQVAVAKRSYGDFLYIFDKYFLKLDRILRAEYERIDDALDEQAGRLRAQAGR